MQRTDDLATEAGTIAAPSFDPSGLAFAPGAVRYIKLGPGGAWAREAFATGQVPFGYRGVSHAACEAKDWDEVRRQLQAMGRSGSGIGQGLREIRDFYELPQNTLWVTVADGHLWWCFAADRVEPALADVLEGPARFRPTVGGWRRDNLAGEPLSLADLSSALTRTANFRMTLCAVEQEAYLLRRIRALDAPLHAETRALQAQMRALALQMVQELDWEDFETLVDLLFSRNGWRRTSVLGKDQRDVDLLLEHPITAERAWVQVKSKATQSELDDYLERFEQDGTFDRFFFACHSPQGCLRLPTEAPSGAGLHLWMGEPLAEMVMQTGLMDWVVQRTR